MAAALRRDKLRGPAGSWLPTERPGDWPQLPVAWTAIVAAAVVVAEICA